LAHVSGVQEHVPALPAALVLQTWPVPEQLQSTVPPHPSERS
jgi:hypothetical protein